MLLEIQQTFEGAMSHPSANMQGVNKASAVARIRPICMALPETQERKAWSAPTFRVRGQMFVMFMDNNHDDGRLAVWCSAPAGVQRIQVAAEPEYFFVAPYVGSRGWLGIRLDTGLDWDIVKAFVKDAYEVTRPRH